MRKASLTALGCPQALAIGLLALPAAIRLLARLVALAGKNARPAPLCMLAWLNWALGRGSIGGRYVDAALAIDPDYGMAQVLNAMLGSGLLPEWAFAKPIEGSIADA